MSDAVTQMKNGAGHVTDQADVDKLLIECLDERFEIQWDNEAKVTPMGSLVFFAQHVKAGGSIVRCSGSPVGSAPITGGVKGPSPRREDGCPLGVQVNDAGRRESFPATEVPHQGFHVVFVLGGNSILGLPDLLNDLIFHLRRLPSVQSAYIFRGTCTLGPHRRCA